MILFVFVGDIIADSFGSPLQGETYWMIRSEGVALGYYGFSLSG